MDTLAEIRMDEIMQRFQWKNYIKFLKFHIILDKKCIMSSEHKLDEFEHEFWMSLRAEVVGHPQ